MATTKIGYYDSIYTGEEVDAAVSAVQEAIDKGGVASQEDLATKLSNQWSTTSVVEGDGSKPASVVITPSGTANQPVLNFVFKDIKGQTGKQGETGEVGPTPNITINASIDDTVGTPNVEVEKTGTAESPIYSFAFKNIKGEQGEQGDMPNISIGTVTVSNTTGTPSCTITSTPKSDGTGFIFNFAFTNIKGEKGDDGVVAARYIQNVTTSSWTGSSAPYSLSIPASTHKKGTNCSVQIKDASTGEVYGATVKIAPSTGNITIQSNVKIALIVEVFN